MNRASPAPRSDAVTTAFIVSKKRHTEMKRSEKTATERISSNVSGSFRAYRSRKKFGAKRYDTTKRLVYAIESVNAVATTRDARS